MTSTFKTSTCKINVRIVTVLLLALSLNGCSWLFGKEGVFPDRSNDYLKADSLPPLQVPDDVDKRVLGQLYVIPEIDKAEFEYPDEFRAPRPQALSANVYSEKVKIQRLGEKRWIYINTTPSEVWPRVRNFLNTAGLSVEKTDAEKGLIETNWLQFKEESELRQKYLLRIEQGVQPDSTEIHIVHVNASLNDPITAVVNWPEKSMNDEREDSIVRDLASNLADEVNAGAASLLAQTIGGDSKIAIVSRDREPILRMELAMVRAWATLTVALKQEGFRTLEEDSNARIFYIDYRDPEEGEGFFRGWFGGDDDDYPTLNEVLTSLKLADNAENRALFPPIAFQEGKPLKDVKGMLVLVTETPGAIEVTLRDAEGKPLELRQAREYLGIIRRNLI
jgi:outer membrane protein assembly factor BamC